MLAQTSFDYNLPYYIHSTQESPTMINHIFQRNFHTCIAEVNHTMILEVYLDMIYC